MFFHHNNFPMLPQECCIISYGFMDKLIQKQRNILLFVKPNKSAGSGWLRPTPPQTHQDLLRKIVHIVQNITKKNGGSSLDRRYSLCNKGRISLSLCKDGASIFQKEQFSHTPMCVFSQPSKFHPKIQPTAKVVIFFVDAPKIGWLMFYHWKLWMIVVFRLEQSACQKDRGSTLNEFVFAAHLVSIHYSVLIAHNISCSWQWFPVKLKRSQKLSKEEGGKKQVEANVEWNCA